MALRRLILFNIIGFYQKFKIRIISILEQTKPTPKQTDFLASKLDIWGAATVGQAFIWQSNSIWVNYLLITASLIVCVILWLIAFILKGYEQ